MNINGNVFELMILNKMTYVQIDWNREHFIVWKVDQWLYYYVTTSLSLSLSLSLSHTHTHTQSHSHAHILTHFNPHGVWSLWTQKNRNWFFSSICLFTALSLNWKVPCFENGSLGSSQYFVNFSCFILLHVSKYLIEL